MKELNAAQMGTGAGAPCKLPRPVVFADGHGCARLRVECTVVPKNNTGGAVDYTGAKAKDAAACMFSLSTLKVGDKAVEVIDNALPYARAREMLVIMSHDDFLINGTPINQLADATVISAAVAAGANAAAVVIEFVRAFEVVDLGEHAYDYAPGASFMRQIQHEFQRGATFDSGGQFVQSAAADFLWIADTFQTHDDKWPTVPRLSLNEEAGRASSGPAEPCGLLAMWDYTGIGSAIALTIFSLTRKNDAPIHDNARASRVVRDASYWLPLGAYNPNLLVALLHALPDASEKNEIPVGQGWSISQTAAEMAPFKTAWLYIPSRDELAVDSVIGPNVQTAEGVKLVSASLKSTGRLDPKLAALEPFILAHRGSADFETRRGRAYQTGHAPVTHIPDADLRQAQAQIAAAKTPEEQQARASQVAAALAAGLPGGSRAAKGSPTPIAQSLGSKFGATVTR